MQGDGEALERRAPHRYLACKQSGPSGGGEGLGLYGLVFREEGSERERDALVPVSIAAMLMITGKA